MYDYGLIGNCNVSALIHKSSALRWLCFPRPDSEPIFGRILDDQGGEFSIISCNENSKTEQFYLENTNILCTKVSHSDGSAYQILDFCPRFEQHGRVFRPLSVFRILEPLSGSPMIKVSCNPILGWEKKPLKPNQGSNHLKFECERGCLRIHTNMPLIYLINDSTFALKDKTYFSISWDTTLDDDLISVSERFLAQTQMYWRTWVKHCTIPSLFQKEIIRSALTLKLHCFEDTGAILAALTTSLPEELGKERNWDYRYCWLRDAYFVLSAFHNLGHFEEMEGFLKFLLNIAHEKDKAHERLAPVYDLGRQLPLPETTHSNWSGFKGCKPVRSHNQAAEHIQNDVYGEMILTLAPIYFDERFYDLRTKDHEELLGHLGKLAAKSISQPDAGLWEVRGGWQEHSFANLMCWAGLERLERIKSKGYLKSLSLDVTIEKNRAYQALQKAIVKNILRNGPNDTSLDCSLALMPVFHFPQRDIANATINEIMSKLKTEGSDAFFYRYTREDDFGSPQAAFVICSFWLAQALASLGRKDEAHNIIKGATQAANFHGLYAEHFLPRKKLQSGNFPQAYSHVGLINSVFAVSPSWTDVL